MGVHGPHTAKVDTETSRYNFVIAELELATTFCHLALHTEDQPKAERNLRRAEEAYLAANHFLKGIVLTGQEIDAIQKRMDHLFDLLAEARERKQPASEAAAPRRIARSTIKRPGPGPLAKHKIRRRSAPPGDPE